MTPEEAIRYVSFGSGILEVESPKTFEEKFGEAFNMAMDALDKQIPKKPLMSEMYAGTILQKTIIECPVCGSNDITGDYGQNEYEYCPNCGQCICWGDEE